MYTANIISKYILFWTSFRSDSNYSCQSNTMQRETATTPQKSVPGKIKGAVGTDHCDVEPEYIVSVIDMVQGAETSHQSSLHNHHGNQTIKAL